MKLLYDVAQCEKEYFKKLYLFCVNQISIGHCMRTLKFVMAFALQWKYCVLLNFLYGLKLTDY